MINNIMTNKVGTSEKVDAVAHFEATRAAYMSHKRIYATFFWVAFFICLTVSVIHTEFSIFLIIKKLPGTTSFIVKSYSALSWENFWADLIDWYWGFWQWLDALFVSLLMAFTATIVGTTVGGLLSFLASRNLMKNYWLYFVIRRTLEIARTVPDIVWALIFIFPFGPGPLAGVLALMVAALVVIAPPIYIYAWVMDQCLTVWGWSENWRYTRNEARMARDHVKISDAVTNRIRQEFASLGASDVSLRCQNVDLGVKACVSLKVDDKSEMVGARSWSLMDAEGKPPRFFSNGLTSTIQSVRKSVKEERAKA